MFDKVRGALVRGFRHLASRLDLPTEPVAATAEPAPQAPPQAEPWNEGYRGYAGWVPNIRSHLSFSLIGSARGARSFTHPALDTPTRVVLALQKRVINDYPYPDWLARWRHRDIELRWFLSAETQEVGLPLKSGDKWVAEPDRQGLLRGTVQLFPLHDDKRAQADLEHNWKLLADLLDTPRQFKKAKEVRELVARAGTFVRDAGYSVTIEFALMRTGECRLWFQEQIVDLEDDDKHDWLAAQAYYFIKDMVHSHTHHDPTSDQITPLIHFDHATEEERHPNEVKWRRETMWSLSREVERLNRGGKLVDQHRALGIIAYAEEFQDRLLGHVRDASEPSGFKPNTEVHHFDFDHLKASMKSVIDVRAALLSQRVQQTTAGTALFVSSMALISSLVSTHNAALPRSAAEPVAADALKLGSVEWWLPWLAYEPLLTAGAVTLALVSALIFFSKEGTVTLRNGVQRVFSQTIRAISVSAIEDTQVGRWFATAGNLLLALASAFPCYAFLRLIGNGGSW